MQRYQLSFALFFLLVPMTELSRADPCTDAINREIPDPPYSRDACTMAKNELQVEERFLAKTFDVARICRMAPNNEDIKARVRTAKARVESACRSGGGAAIQQETNAPRPTGDAVCTSAQLGSAKHCVEIVHRGGTSYIARLSRASGCPTEVSAALATYNVDGTCERQTTYLSTSGTPDAILSQKDVRILDAIAGGSPATQTCYRNRHSGKPC